MLKMNYGNKPPQDIEECIENISLFLQEIDLSSIQNTRGNLCIKIHSDGSFRILDNLGINGVEVTEY